MPDYTWFDDLHTGIFHPSAYTIAFSSDGSEAFRIARSRNILIGNTGDWGEKLSVTAGEQPALVTYVDHKEDYLYAQVSNVNNPLSKALAVKYNSNEKFKVFGNGDVWAFGSYTSSDSLLKENVTPITDALQKVMLLKGVSYNYIPEILNDPNDTITIISTDPPKTLIGLMAEEVEPIVPEVVKTFEDGLKGILYGNLVALLIEAIKEQQIQIDILEVTLTSLLNNQNSDQPNIEMNQLKDSDGNGIENDPDKPILYQNTPNPFSAQTDIRYYLPNDVIDASLLIFDMQGTLIKTFRALPKGHSSIVISGRQLRPGMYLYTLIVDKSEICTRKMILMEN